MAIEEDENNRAMDFSLASRKKKESGFFDKFKALGRGMNFADGIFVALTAANLAANPRGARGIHDVIKANQKQTNELATSRASAALRRVHGTTVPKINENEAWINNTTQYITNELQGVDMSFISALIKADKLEEFREMVSNINTKRAGKGHPKLTASELEEMIPALKNFDSAFSSIEGLDENTPEKVSKALRKFYGGYQKLLETANTPNELRAGVFASSYGGLGASMDLANRYLRSAGQAQIGEDSYSYDRLSELPLGSIGFDQEQLVPVPGGIDYSRGVPSELDAKIEEKLNSELNQLSMIGQEASVSATLAGLEGSRSVSKFSQMYDPDVGDFGLIWSGDIEELRNSKNALAQELREYRQKLSEEKGGTNRDEDLINQLSTKVRELELMLGHHQTMEQVAQGGNGIYALLHREAYMQMVEENRKGIIPPDQRIDYVSALGENMSSMIKEAKNTTRQFQQDHLLMGYMAEYGIDQNYVFADRHSLNLFIKVMGGTDGGLIFPGTKLSYRNSAGQEESILVENVLNENNNFMRDAQWRYD
tara:strand:+ start:2801 stop:4420 length:1620 start_codon:yes stop_codon:yes gene_type:complete